MEPGGESELAQSLRAQREAALRHGTELLADTWQGFDRPRPGQPAVSDATREALATPLPEEGIGVVAALDGAAEVLDASLAHSRPRYFGDIGSSGL